MDRMTLGNAGLFQLNWFACVLGGAAQEPAWPLLSLAAMLLLCARTEHVKEDLLLVAVCSVLGFGLDSIWIALGFLDFNGQAYAPVWIVMLWAGVALTINHSLRWLQARPLLGGVLAGASAPLCYYGGARLEAVVVTNELALVVIGVCWAIVFTMIFSLTNMVGVWRLARTRSPT